MWHNLRIKPWYDTAFLQVNLIKISRIWSTFSKKPLKCSNFHDLEFNNFTLLSRVIFNLPWPFFLSFTKNSLKSSFMLNSNHHHWKDTAEVDFNLKGTSFSKKRFTSFPSFPSGLFFNSHLTVLSMKIFFVSHRMIMPVKWTQWEQLKKYFVGLSRHFLWKGKRE